MKIINLKRDTLLHIIDALSAAKSAGLRLDMEQFVFDRSLKRAGGLSSLQTMASLVPQPKNLYRRRTPENDL